MKSLGNFPDPFIAEISGQPDALRRAAEGTRTQADGLERVAAAARERTVVFTGMGSSYDACYPAVTELAQAGIAAVMLDSAELLHFRTGMLGPGTVLVAVSQSGESAEVVRVVQEVRTRAAEQPTVVTVTNGTDNTLARLADLSFDTRAGNEAGPSTMTFAASLVVVAAVGRAIAGRAVTTLVEDLHDAAGSAASAIELLLADRALPELLVAWLDDRETFVILGRGPARAAAEMGALTIKEAVGMPVESLQTAQFRHGPLELAGPNLAAMVIATEPETSALDLALADELLETGVAVMTVTERPVGAGHANGAPNVDVGPVDRALAPAVSILPAQLLAWRLAALRGREPGTYHRASKVTTRE
jgi:glutamine---fructose-6-phosphate transaminase (isomerizing)